MKRFLPLPVFAILQAYVILSLLATPAPWGAGGTGYDAMTVYVSAGSGVALGVLVMMTSLSDRLPYRTYLAISVVFGAAFLAYAFVALDPGTTARSMFLVYGAILFGTGLCAKIPVARSAESLRMDPTRPQPPVDSGVIQGGTPGLRTEPGSSPADSRSSDAVE